MKVKVSLRGISSRIARALPREELWPVALVLPEGKNHCYIYSHPNIESFVSPKVILLKHANKKIWKRLPPEDRHAICQIVIRVLKESSRKLK